MPGKANKTQDAGKSQCRILAAAEEVFAEKGFDGARVDEIARRAGVNKALLYYYFESKEQILRALTEKHFKEIVEAKQCFVENLSPDEPDLMDRIGRHSMELLADRKSFLRIIAIEALKDGTFALDFFRIIDSIVTHLNSLANKTGMDEDQLARFRMNIYFFGMAPILFYHSMGEKWLEYSGMEEQAFKQMFIEDFRKYYVNPIKNTFELEHRGKL